MPKYNLHLKGYVGASDFRASDVDKCLAQNEDNDVRVLIDSTGGQLATALSIAAAFKSHGAVDVHFVGLNASAATVASLGARTISMDRNAMYLVHKCSNLVFAWRSMNADELEQYINDLIKNKADLDKIDDNIAAMYAARCRKDKEALINLMAEGAWLNAKEALDWGFVDKITDDVCSKEPHITAALAADFEAAGIPLPGKVEKPSSYSIAGILAAIADFFKISSKADKKEIEAVQERHQVECDGTETSDSSENVDDVESPEVVDALDEPQPDPEPVTSQVIDTGKSEQDSDLNSYIDTELSARKLFNSIP